MNELNNQSKNQRKQYNPEFKDQALARAEKDGISQVAKDLGLSESMLYSWRTKQRQSDSTLENQKMQQAEMARLKREVKRLAMENDFLKKAAAYFAKESE